MPKSVFYVIVGYLIFGISAGLLFGLSGQDPEQLPSIAFMAGSIVYGMAFAFAGGWVSAYLARRKEIQHASAVAAIILVLALVSIAIQFGHASMWSQLAAVFLVAPSAVAGGVVRRIQNKSV